MCDIHCTGWLKEYESLFPLLNGSPWLLRVVSTIFVIISNVSVFSMSLTAGLFALVTLNLAEEFDKLYRIICNLAFSTRVGMVVWEQVRFRHEALVSLLCLHDQLFTMLLGPILVGYVGYLILNLYGILMVEAHVLGMINIIISVSMLGSIITPANILENTVRETHIPKFISPVVNHTHSIITEL